MVIMTLAWILKFLRYFATGTASYVIRTHAFHYLSPKA